MRWVPILGLLAALALVPGALAHHCIPEEDNDQFSVQSTVAAPISPAAVGGILLVPLVVIGGALAVVRNAPAAKPLAGRWVCTPTQWVWVPERP